MFESICTFPLQSDLFAQAIHPGSPLFALGLASGHVQLQRLPFADTLEARNGTIETAWRTRRHKGSCRSLCFNHDGERLLSAGTDGIVKVAVTETGRVESKIAVPLHRDSIDPTSVLNALSPQTLLLATDSSALYLYDLRADLSSSPCKPQQTYHPHGDEYVSSITPLIPTGKNIKSSDLSRQWATTGGSTVAIVDIRRGVLVKSEDQGEELLSSCVVDGKLVVGSEKGTLRVWQVGSWDDNEQSVEMAAKGAMSADVLAPVTSGQPMVVVGMDDGSVRLVDVGRNKPKVLEEAEIRHDEVDGVLGLGFEVGGRLISGGGQVVKVWEEGYEDEEDGIEKSHAVNGKRLNGFGSDEDDSAEDANEDSDEERQRKKKKKKRKRNKDKTQRGGEQHVIAFKGMD